MLTTDALVEAEARSRYELSRHEALLAWRPRLPFGVGLAWMPWPPSSLPADPGPTDRAPTRAQSRSSRALRRAADQAALAAAVRDLDPSGDPRACRLYHSALGQPRVSRRSADAAGCSDRLQISYSHDGAAHLAVVAAAPGLVGVGIDILRWQRFLREGQDEAYVKRLAHRFMGDEEHALFCAASADDDRRVLALRVAAHFSLMESASKALGTGLRLGGGIGAPGSLPLAAIGVRGLAEPVAFALGEAAEARLARLAGAGRGRLAGYWSHDDEYVTTFVAVWRDTVHR